MNKSVVLRSTLSHALIALLTVLPILLASYFLLQRKAASDLNKELTQLLSERRSHVLSYLELEAARIYQVAKRDSLLGSLKEYNSKEISLSDFRYKIEKELGSLLASEQGYSSISIIDLQGMIIASSNEKEVGKYMESIAEGKLENNFFIFSNENELILVTPFLLGEKEQAFLMLVRNSDSLNQIVSNRSSNISVMLGNSNNVFLPLDKGIEGRSWDVSFEKGILSKQAVYETLDSSETKLLVSTLSLGYKDWILAAQTEQASFYSAIMTYLGRLSAVAMICFAFGVLLNFWLTRKLFSRLFELLDVTNQIKSGALYARANAEGEDELSTLAASVNEIADTLEKEVFKRRKERERGVVGFNALAEKAYYEVKPKYDSKGVALELVFSDKELSSWVVSAELEEVLTKLLETSLSYSESDSTVVIRVCEDEDSNASIVIKDWNGFSNEHREVYRDARSVIGDFGGDLEIHSKRGGVNSVSLIFMQAEDDQQLIANS